MSSFRELSAQKRRPRNRRPKTGRHQVKGPRLEQLEPSTLLSQRSGMILEVPGISSEQVCTMARPREDAVDEKLSARRF